MQQKVDKNFNPTIFHPAYIIRSRIYRGIKKYAPELKGKVMDFGCGSKPYKSLVVNADEYIGVDYAGEGHSHSNEQIDIYYDGISLPFADNTFDAIITSEVFEHIFNLENILKELNRVLKPGGKILITCPFVWNEHEVPVDFGRYTSFGMRALLERNNFEILALDRSSHFIETLTQMWLTYWHNHIIPKTRPFGRVTQPTISFLINFFGLSLSKILPKKYDWYLNLIVLACKKNS